MKTNYWLIRFIKPFSHMVVLSIILGISTVASSIGLLGTAAYLIAKAAYHPSIATLQIAIVGVRFFGITRSASRYLERLVSHSVNFQLLAKMRVWFYQKIEPLAPAKLEYHKSGDLLERVVGDIDVLENYYIRVISPPLIAIIITSGVCLFCGWFDIRLGIILSIGFGFNAFILPLFIYICSKKSGCKLIKYRSELKSEIIDGIQGIADILVLNFYHEKIKKILILNRKYNKEKLKSAIQTGLAEGFNQLLQNLTVWSFLIISIFFVNDREFSGIVLTTLVIVVLASFEAIHPLTSAAKYYGECIEAALRLFELVNDDKLYPKDGLFFLSDLSEVNIQIKDLCFRYKDDEPFMLNNINIYICYGERIAIVGPSGSGKTTLVNLLLRFWDYKEGKILINNIELRDLNIKNVRDIISVHTQSVYIFNGTLYQNLIIANENASEADLLEVLEKVNLYSWFKSLANGMSTWLGEHGVKLSGGEMQRLSIARLLLRNSPIMIFDEPFKNLDRQNEIFLMKTLDEFSRGHTVLWITHRLVDMEKFSKILVMKNGNIIESGSHIDLIARGDYYAQMLDYQRVVIDGEIV